MLNQSILLESQCNIRGQRGVVLLIAMILLIAMSMAGIMLVRSVYTTNIIAGNIAFQQAAMHSSDAGIEAAISWLEANKNGTTLHNSIDKSASNPVAYVAFRQDPIPNQSWEEFWSNALLAANQVNTLSQDASGNTVAYVIHRLCNGLGDPTTGIGCATAPAKYNVTGGSKGVEVVGLKFSGQVYYRITTRVSGPRNTVSYVQAVIAM